MGVPKQEDCPYCEVKGGGHKRLVCEGELAEAKEQARVMQLMGKRARKGEKEAQVALAQAREPKPRVCVCSDSGHCFYHGLEEFGGCLGCASAAAVRRHRDCEAKD